MITLFCLTIRVAVVGAAVVAALVATLVALVASAFATGDGPVVYDFDDEAFEDGLAAFEAMLDGTADAIEEGSW